MKTLVICSILALMPLLAVAQEDLQLVSETDAKPIMVGAVKDNEQKALYDYAAAQLKMKAPSSPAGNATSSVTTVKDQTGKVYKLTTILQNLEPINANDKAVGAILQVTNETTGKVARTIIYDKIGDGANVQEFSASKVGGKLQVGGIGSFISCLLSKTGQSAQTIIMCRQVKWTDRFKCIARNLPGFGLAYAKCAWKLLW